MNTIKTPYAFGLIDAQRGFMPAEEGVRLGVEGFGELPITDGEKIVPNVNALLAQFAIRRYGIFTTQDWHPRETAHFAEEPDFTTTWPRHCVADTPGAELHPSIKVPSASERFLKGQEPLADGKDDISYSGYNAVNKEAVGLPEWLECRGVTSVVLGGLALDYCVGLTAIDLKQKMDLKEVTVVVDATRPVSEGTGQAMLDKFDKLGINIASTDEVIRYTHAAM